MSRNVRGAYVHFTHDRAADWDWLAKWQPNVIRYMGQGSIANANSFDLTRVVRLHQTCPDATILLRCWEVDDNNFTAHDAMVANPRGEAERQVNWWAQVIARAESLGIPRDKLMAGLNNETGPEKDAALFVYSEEALKLGTEKRVRLGVCVFSAGRPALEGESQYDIRKFSQLDSLVSQNQGAFLLHEYMQPEGMYAVWTDAEGDERKDYTYLIGRHLRWQIKSPIIIAEWGIDGILYNRHPDPVYGNSGWRNFPKDWPPSRFADEYVECVRVASDNVIGICPFISDFADHKWQSFDVLEAYGELLARKDLCVKEANTPPVTVHLPSVGNGPSVPQEVKPVTGIIDPRVAQAILNIESGGRTHGADGKPIIRFEAHIFKQMLGNDALWGQHFRADVERPWTRQEWRQPDGAWKPLHNGPQADEWAAYEVAKSINPEAAAKSISMGAGQVMGFNHARIGYPSARAMLEAFQSAPVQTIGFLNYFLSDPGLVQAMRDKNWREIAKRYNGAGAIDTYAPLLERAYNELAQA